MLYCLHDNNHITFTRQVLPLPTEIISYPAPVSYSFISQMVTVDTLQQTLASFIIRRNERDRDEP
jgi:hypothetical protein